MATKIEKLRSFNIKKLDWLKEDGYRLCRPCLAILHSNFIPSFNDNTFQTYEHLVAQIQSKSDNIKDQEDHADILKSKAKEQCLPIDLFDWIDNKNPRLCYWLIDHCFRARIQIKQNSQTSEEKRNAFISAIDEQGRVNPDTPLGGIFQIQRRIHEDIKKAWSKNLHSEAFDWFDGKDAVQVNWAWKYISNKEERLNEFSPSNDKECYISILMFLDTFWQHSSQRKLLIAEMKQAWRQKRNRDKNDGKKPYTFNMSDNIGDIIKAMAKKKHMTQGEFIEELIRTEQHYLKNNL